MHLSMWTLWYLSSLTQGILMENRLVHQNIHPATTFPVGIPIQKIYISTTCNIRMISERIDVTRVLSMVRWNLSYDGGGGARFILTCALLLLQAQILNYTLVYISHIKVVKPGMIILYTACGV